MRPLFRVLSLAALAAVASLPPRAAETDPALPRPSPRSARPHFDGEHRRPGRRAVLNAAVPRSSCWSARTTASPRCRSSPAPCSRALAPEGFRHLVLEIGPLSARAWKALRRDPDALARRLEKATPSGCPRLARDADLAAAAVAARPGACPCGRGPGIHPRRACTSRACGGAGARCQGAASGGTGLQRKETAAYRRMVRQHPTPPPRLTRLGDKDSRPQRQAYTDASPEALAIIDLLDSAPRSTAPAHGALRLNCERSRVMKFQFMARFTARRPRARARRACFSAWAPPHGARPQPHRPVRSRQPASELAESNGGPPTTCWCWPPAVR